MARKILIPPEWLKEQYVVRHLKISECAKLQNCTDSVIRKRLNLYGIPIRPKGTRYPNVDQKWIEKNYVDEQKDIATCARLAGCSFNAMHDKIVRCDIPLHTHRFAISKDWLIKNYIEKELSSSQCGQLVGCSLSTILNWLDHYNLPKRCDSLEKAHERILELASQGKWGMHGAKNPQWRGGITEHRYCSKFTDRLKEEIREAFGRKCFLCGVPENGYKHHVHHIDFNKVQGCKGKRWALMPLCPNCHHKTSHNRHYYFNLLINYWAMDLNINFKAGELCNDGI